jgi:hypothetical protein
VSFLSPESPLSPALIKPIPFDPFAVGREFGVREITARLMERGTPQTRREHDWLTAVLEGEFVRVLDDAPQGLAMRMRSRGGMAYLTFSSGLLGSGRIASGIDPLTGRAVFQVRGSALAAPVAAALLGAVRGSVIGLEKPLRILARPTGPAAFDPAMYRPDRVATFRPRGLGRGHNAKHARVDLMTCWVGGEALGSLLRALITGVEVAREAVTRSGSPDVVHAYADDVMRPGK